MILSKNALNWPILKILHHQIANCLRNYNKTGPTVYNCFDWFLVYSILIKLDIVKLNDPFFLINNWIKWKFCVFGKVPLIEASYNNFWFDLRIVLKIGKIYRKLYAINFFLFLELLKITMVTFLSRGSIDSQPKYAIRRQIF